MSRASCLLVLSCLALCRIAHAVDIAVPDGGFEQPDGWRIGEQMSTLSTAQAAAGKQSLKVVDDDDKLGSDVLSQPIPVDGDGVVEVHGKIYPLSGSGLGIYLRCYDAQGQQVGKGDEFQIGAPTAPTGGWRDFVVRGALGPTVKSVRIWIHSYSHAHVAAYLDDFRAVWLTMQEASQPLWTPQYKLKPTDRLTAADVVGPDGLVYPNWTRAGVQGGIPNVPVKAKAAEFGAKPDDGQDDAAAIEAACDKVGVDGGGAVLLEAGIYHLDRPVNIRRDGVVIRGAGMAQTQVIFRYNLGPTGARFGEPWTHDGLYPDTTTAFQALPDDKLQALEIFVGEQRVAGKSRSTHWGNTFDLTVKGSNVLKALPAEATTVTLRGVATYDGGQQRTAERVYQVHREGSDPEAIGLVRSAVFGFGGQGWDYPGPYGFLAADGRRGQTDVQLKSVDTFKPGMWVLIDGPATKEWKELTHNACQWGAYRRNVLQIASIEGNTVRFTEPLRIDFPVSDESRLKAIRPIQRCGVEDLTIEQTENLWITTVLFNSAVDCWARGVKVKKCGRFPVYSYLAKHLTYDGCVFDDAWFKGGGGTAYAGFEYTYDSLMQNCATYKLRHAPCVQWSASGNVIRHSEFYDSDMQWHSGWTNENLMEQCVVRSQVGNGSYGHAAWASPPEDTAHGPNGPRNVVYNCDLEGQKDGLWMGGMNENWMILYNRLIAGSGTAIFARMYSFDHVIRGNHLGVHNTTRPALTLATPDCSGVEFYDNVVYGGNGQSLGGLSKLLVERDNQSLPWSDDIPRPEPAVPSIYEWQLAHVK